MDTELGSLPVKSRKQVLYMRRQKYTGEQVINILREGEAGAKMGDLCHKYGVSGVTYHRWKVKNTAITLA